MLLEGRLRIVHKSYTEFTFRETQPATAHEGEQTMTVPTTHSSWTQSLEMPSRVFGADGPFGLFGADDYELYEEDGEFVLSVEIPGFEP